MNFKGREMTAAMARRTKEALMARKALNAAAVIHTTTAVMLFVCLAVPLHPVLG
jgi:hypothetical protein